MERSDGATDHIPNHRVEAIQTLMEDTERRKSDRNVVLTLKRREKSVIE
jgi:hypothetical protein